MAETSLHAQRIETTVGDGGRVLLENLPYPAGLPIEVIVLAQADIDEPTPSYPLRGTSIVYRDYDPFGPAVPDENWDALQ